MIHIIAYRKQILYALIVSLQTFNVGRGIGWPMPASLYFLSNHSRRLIFPGAEQEEDIVPAFDHMHIALINSIAPLVASIYLTISILVRRSLSPKVKIAFVSMTDLICWLIAIFGDQTPLIFIIARLFFGISTANLLNVPLYIEEMTESEIRGGLVCLSDCLINGGVMIGFIIGSNTSFKNALWINLTLSTLSILTIFYLPESPLWLMAQNKRLEAKNILQKFRHETHDFETELDNIALYINNKNEYSIKEVIQSLRNKRSNRKSFFIVLILFIIINASGIAIIQNYAIEILREIDLSFSEYKIIIIIGVCCLLGSITACLLSDKIGRRPLLLISISMVILCLALLALYTSGLVNINLIPKIAIPIHVFSMNFGMGPIPYVMMSELLPPSIRKFGSNICLITMSLLFFIVLCTFSSVIRLIGLHLTLTFYMLLSICSFAFVYFVLPETKKIPRHLMEKTIYKEKREVFKEELTSFYQNTNKN